MSTNKNDAKIKELLKEVEKRKSELGAKPKVAFTTNCILRCMSVNINTITKEIDAINAMSFLLAGRKNRAEAAKELGIDYKEELIDGYSYEDWRNDIKLRLEIIKWNQKDQELRQLEKKLFTLISEEARTESELDNIAALLGK